MELRELRSFCSAARLRSISKAAESLGIGQPSVTAHVKKLEGGLGTLLFDRVKRPIQLTLAGTKLFQMAMPLVEGLDKLIPSVSTAEEEGPVRIASSYEIISHTLTGLVEEFLSRYPHVHLRIRSGTMQEVLDLLLEGEVDVGILPGPEKGSDFEFEGLFPYERVLITPLGHPLLQTPVTSLDQIVQWPLILMERRTSTRRILEQEFQRRGLAYDVIIELDSMDLIKRYVALGLGVSIGPKLAIDPGDERQLGIVNLAALLPLEQAGIVTVKGKSLSKPARNFIRVVKQSLNSRAS